MDQVELRIRPVTRFNLTLFTRNGSNSCSKTLAELPNADTAREIGTSMAEAIPGAVLLDEKGERVEGLHTHYPARFAIGSRAMRKATLVRQPGGELWEYGDEVATIRGIHFTEGKVCYSVGYPTSGRADETIDSVELDSIPTPESATNPAI